MFMDSNSKQSQQNNLDCDEEVFMQNFQGTQQDLYFDTVVGTLQDIVMQPDFSQLQENFMRNHCSLFSSCQENKLQYTTIFKKYEQTIEKYIIQKLSQQIANFNMQIFSNLLQSRKQHIDEELLQMIHSFTDFQVFKAMMVEYKSYLEKEKLGAFDGLLVKGMGRH